MMAGCDVWQEGVAYYLERYQKSRELGAFKFQALPMPQFPAISHARRLRPAHFLHPLGRAERARSGRRAGIAGRLCQRPNLLFLFLNRSVLRSSRAACPRQRRRTEPQQRRVAAGPSATPAGPPERGCSRGNSLLFFLLHRRGLTGLHHRSNSSRNLPGPCTRRQRSAALRDGHLGPPARQG